MPEPKLKSPKQMKAIFSLAKKNGVDMDDDTRAALAVTVSNGRTDRLSLLTFDEANGLIKHLGGDPIGSSRTPRRTVNYHRQQAGVHQIAQPNHLNKMVAMAEERGISDDGLKGLCRRMLKGNSWPRTTAETNKIIEAIKAMNERDAKREKEAA